MYHLRYRLDPVAQRIAWELDDRYENDLGLVEGFWDLYAMDDARTLGRFGTRVDVGPAIPAFLQDWLTRNKIPTTMENARLWINSRGRYRP